jgi:crotonyl-CoA carboxylase/reductase
MADGLPRDKSPDAHEKMLDNKHAPGNMAVLVTAQRSGLRTYEDVLEGSGAAG